MKYYGIKNKILLSLALFFPLVAMAEPLRPLYLEQLQLPPGFEIRVFARIPFVRQLNVATDGMIYAGSSHHEGKGIIYAIKPTPDLSSAEKIYELVTGLEGPIGVAYWKRDLYIGERYRIIKIPNITDNWDHPSPFEIVMDHIPSAKNGHSWKYLKFGPDHRLYFQIGDPVDTSESDDPLVHSILSITAEGKDLQIYARGIRNTVGFDWEPNTHILYFTDNGQDRLGEDYPPDEINRAPKKGMHFGFPCYVGHNYRLLQYTNCPQEYEVTPPIVELEAHAAPLGLFFYTGNAFPTKYRNNMFVAQHGSSARKKILVGYNILRVVIDKDKVKHVVPFVTGWLQSSHFWGRPVDMTQLPDGSMLISDDYSGTIYRVTYIGKKK